MSTQKTHSTVRHLIREHVKKLVKEAFNQPFAPLRSFKDFHGRLLRALEGSSAPEELIEVFREEPDESPVWEELWEAWDNIQHGVDEAHDLGMTQEEAWNSELFWLRDVLGVANDTLGLGMGPGELDQLYGHVEGELRIVLPHEED